MNNFKKAALASSVLALTAISGEASAGAISSSTVAMIGCSLPANTTAGATVYSVDAYDSNAAVANDLPYWLKAGASCSKAVNWMLATGGANLALNKVTNQVASGGYSLQNFVFGPAITGSIAATGSAVSMVGCAAPASGTSGAPVYSVDTQGSAGTAVNGLTLSGLSAVPCSSALSQTGSSTLDGLVSLQTADGAYSLQQYIVQ